MSAFYLPACFHVTVTVTATNVPVSAEYAASATQAVRQSRGMAYAYARQVDRQHGRSTKLQRAADLVFGTDRVVSSRVNKAGETVETTEAMFQERGYASSLRGKRPSKHNPAGVAPYPVTLAVGDFTVNITPIAATVFPDEVPAHVVEAAKVAG